MAVSLDQCLNACTWTHLWAIAYGRGLAVPRKPTKAGLLALIRADLAAFPSDLQGLAPDALAAVQMLASNGGWLPAHVFCRRFGPLRPFKPWGGRPASGPPPWRAPASITEQLWYRGLLYARRQPEGSLGLPADGFCLPDELLSLAPPLPSPAQPAAAPANPAEPPHLFYNLAIFLAHLAALAPRPRQGRWLTPSQFRPVLDLLWPPGCPILAADRQAQGERATHLLRALHLLAEAAGFLAAPPPPVRHFRGRGPGRPAVEEILSCAPPSEDHTIYVTDARPRAARRRTAVDREPAPVDRLIPTPVAHDWLQRPLSSQIAHLRPILAGQAEGQAHQWRVYQLPGWQEKDALAALRRLTGALALCPAGGAWLDLEVFLRRLPRRYPELLPEQAAGRDDPHRQLLAGFLAWLGVVQLDRWASPACFRLTPLGAVLVGAGSLGGLETATPAFCLADAGEAGLSLAVDPAAAPQLVYRLRAHPRVEWTAAGQARLGPASLAGASGQEVGDLVGLLDSGLEDPLPAEAIAALQRRAGEGACLVIRRVTLLETGDAELLACLAGQRGIRRHFGQAYGRRAVELDSNSLEGLLRKLRRQGLVPEVQVSLTPTDRPAAGRRWGPEDAGHLLLAAKVYNRLPAHLRPAATLPGATLERLAEGLAPRIGESVDQMAEETLRRLHEALDGWRSPPPGARPNPQAVAETVALLRRALESGRPVELDYYTAGRGELTHRVVEPLRLEERDGVPYLAAYCRLRRDERVFRVDRIGAARVCSQG